jgi:hypothetical protein
LCVKPGSNAGPEWTRLPLGGPQYGINIGINSEGRAVVRRATAGVGRAVHGADGSRTGGRSRATCRSRATGVRWRHGHADGAAEEAARPRRAIKVDVTRAGRLTRRPAPGQPIGSAGGLSKARRPKRPQTLDGHSGHEVSSTPVVGEVAPGEVG